MAARACGNICGWLSDRSSLYHPPGPGQRFTQNYLGLFTCLTAPCAYLLVKYVTSRIPAKPGFQKTVSAAAGLTLGVYLMDPLFNHFFFSRLYNPIAVYVHPVTYSLAYCLLSMTVCSTVTYVLKKLPIAGKLLSYRFIISKGAENPLPLPIFCLSLLYIL